MSAILQEICAVDKPKAQFTSRGCRLTQSTDVLIVDDEPEIVNLFSIYLSQRGYSVLTAENGREALEILTEEQPTVVILDVSMPEMDGIETLKRIMRLSNPPGVVMITAVSDARVFDAVKNGAYGYLLKPFPMEELETTILACIRQRDSEGLVS